VNVTKNNAFPEFAQLPPEWPVVAVSDLFEIQQGKQVSKKNRVGDNQRPFLRTRNVMWGRLNLAELDQMHFTDRDEKRLALRNGDLLLCEGGSVGRAAIWRGEVDRCYYQNHLHRLRIVNGGADPKFALYWFWYAFELGNMYFGRKNVTTIPNMSKSRLGGLPMPQPDIPEQYRIAAVLSLVQRAIEQQDRLIALTTELKKALMHKLFTEGTRGEPQKQTEIGPIPESWEVVELSKLLADRLQNGAFVKKPKKGRGFLFANVVDMYRETYLDCDKLERIDVSKKDIGQYFLNDGDLLVVRSSLKREGIGQNCITRNLPEPVFFDCHLIRVNPDTERLLPEFLSYFWRSSVGKTDLIRRSKTTTMTTINQQGLASALVPLPDFSEQAEIARTLQTVDVKIITHRRAMKVLSVLFRTLLHQLMIAEIRVNDLNLEEFGLDSKK